MSIIQQLETRRESYDHYTCMTQQHLTSDEETRVTDWLVQSFRNESQFWSFGASSARQGCCTYRQAEHKTFSIIFYGPGACEIRLITDVPGFGMSHHRLLFRDIENRRRVFDAMHEMRHNHPETSPVMTALNEIMESTPAQTTIAPAQLRIVDEAPALQRTTGFRMRREMLERFMAARSNRTAVAAE